MYNLDGDWRPWILENRKTNARIQRGSVWILKLCIWPFSIKAVNNWASMLVYFLLQPTKCLPLFPGFDTFSWKLMKVICGKTLTKKKYINKKKKNLIRTAYWWAMSSKVKKTNKTSLYCSQISEQAKKKKHTTGYRSLHTRLYNTTAIKKKMCTVISSHYQKPPSTMLYWLVSVRCTSRGTILVLLG